MNLACRRTPCVKHINQQRWSAQMRVGGGARSPPRARFGLRLLASLQQVNMLRAGGAGAGACPALHFLRGATVASWLVSPVPPWLHAPPRCWNLKRVLGVRHHPRATALFGQEMRCLGMRAHRFYALVLQRPLHAHQVGLHGVQGGGAIGAEAPLRVVALVSPVILYPYFCCVHLKNSFQFLHCSGHAQWSACFWGQGPYFRSLLATERATADASLQLRYPAA